MNDERMMRVSREEKEAILNVFRELPQVVKTAFAAGKAFGDLAAQTAPDGPGPDRTAEQDNLSDSQTPAQAAPTNLTSMN